MLRNFGDFPTKVHFRPWYTSHDTRGGWVVTSQATCFLLLHTSTVVPKKSLKIHRPKSAKKRRLLKISVSCIKFPHPDSWKYILKNILFSLHCRTPPQWLMTSELGWLDFLHDCAFVNSWVASPACKRPAGLPAAFVPWVRTGITMNICTLPTAGIIIAMPLLTNWSMAKSLIGHCRITFFQPLRLFLFLVKHDRSRRRGLGTFFVGRVPWRPWRAFLA